MPTSDELRRKAKWHAERAGTGMPAKVGKVGEYTYQAELRERGVKNDDGTMKPLIADRSKIGRSVDELMRGPIRKRTKDSTSDEHEMSNSYAFR